MKERDQPIIVEQTFRTTISSVWRAITEVDQMRQWYFENIQSFKPEVGFVTQFNVKSGDRDFLHLWKVTEVLPGKKITYNWKYDGIPGDSFIQFELVEQDGSTELKLTHTVTNSFPDDIPEFSRESGIQGWEYFIKKSLKAHLEKT